MRVGFVRNVALGMVALVGLGLAGCDDNPTDFDTDETVKITTNPTVITLPAGVTTLLSSRTENAGNQPTWEEISWTVDGSCGPGAITVDVAATFEPDIQPSGQFDVTGGTTMGETCIQLSGGGASATVEVTVVGDSLEITGAPELLDLFSSVDLGAVLLSDDGTPVSPFDDATDIVWSSSDEAILTVDADGVVTAVSIGGATITATWTDFGVSVSESVAIGVNAPTLEILNVPTDSLVIDTSVDLDVALVNPTDPPADFGPFDQNTDVTWSSSDTDVLEVDAATGEVTAVGFGTATITVTWNAAEAISASTDISVSIPAPTLVSASQATANLGDLITLVGTDFHPAMTVFVDSVVIDPIYDPTIVNATTVTFHFPFGEDGDVEVLVGAPGELSNPLTITREIVDSTEPDNDGFGTAPVVVLPVDRWGVVDGDDLDDRFKFTLVADATIQLDLDWIGASGDLDLLVVDDPVTAFQCGFVTATGAHPEGGECDLTAGDYILWVNSYDEAQGIYHLEVNIVP